MTKEVAVIGGGLQGVLAAIACAKRGFNVVVFERQPSILQGASRNNEGKVHRGFTYGLDDTGKTQALMAQYGSAFGKAVVDLLEVPAESFVVAREVVYARHQDSLMSDVATARHFETVAKLQEDPVPSAMHPLPKDELLKRFSGNVDSAYVVAEETIDVEKLCIAAAQALGRIATIRVHTAADISHVTPDATPSVIASSGESFGTFDAVMNCAWDGLPELDRRSEFGSAGYCLRAKAGFIANVEAGMPDRPITFCFGPFGDIVPLDKDLAYISWYPSCLMGFTTDLAPGSGWFSSLQSRFDFGGAYEKAVYAFESLCRGLRLSRHYEKVLAGAILAMGSTDIDNRESKLHKRTQIGIRRRDALFSVNPGKLTMTPRLAIELAEQL
jgi:hypothetical protein